MVTGKLLFLCAFVVYATCDTTPMGVPYLWGDENKCNIPLNLTREFIELQFINEAVYDDFKEDAFFSFPLPHNVTEWQLGEYGNSPYITAEVKDRVVILKPTEAFSRMEYTESSSKPIELSFYLKFTCGVKYVDETKFYFKQIINDINNHEPTFNRKVYKYHFGMELKEEAVLTDVMEIYAVDVDFTNDDVEFSIQKNEWFAIEHETNYYEKKIYYPILKSKKVVPKGEYSYEITVTDKGTPPKKGTATIHVKIE